MPATTVGPCSDKNTHLEQLAQALQNVDIAFRKLQASMGFSMSSEPATLLPPAGRFSVSGSHNLRNSERASLIMPRSLSAPHGRPSESSVPSSAVCKSPSLQGQVNGFRLLECWEVRRSQLGSLGGLQYMQLMGSIDTRHRTSEYDATVGPATHPPPNLLKHVIIHPHGIFRFAWDIFSLVLVLYDMFVIPLHFFDIEETPFLIAMNWITRMFWSSDMLVSPISGYMQADGVIEMRPRRIIVRYLCTWFLLDCLVVGIDWLEFIMKTSAGGLGIARFGKTSRIFRIVRLLRLARLARMREVWELLCERFDSQTLVIILDSAKLLVVMFAIGHLVGCVFYAVGTMNDDDVNWIKYYEFSNKTTEYKYIMSVRWAMSQFAGGMDEVTPRNIDESIYAGIMFFASYWCGAVFLSVLTSSMTEFFLQGTQQRQKLTLLRHYLANNGISSKLCVRVNRNAAHAVRMKEKTEPEGVAELILLVSEPLQREIHFEMYEHVLEVHPFFGEYIEKCPHIMRRVCHSSVSMTTESAGDVIFNVGEVPEHPRMYIVSKGSLAYSSWVREETNLLEDDWIAEATLWVEWMYRGSLTVSQDSLLCKVDAHKFQQTCSQFEHVDFDPRKHGSNFVELLNAAGDNLSDLPPRRISAATKNTNSSVNSIKGITAKLTSSLKTSTSFISNRTTTRTSHASAAAAISQTLFALAPPTAENPRRAGETSSAMIESWIVKDVAEVPGSPKNSGQNTSPVRKLGNLPKERIVVLL